MNNRLTRHRVLPLRNQSENATGAEIILDYFREQYAPDFRRGNAIHSHTGVMIQQLVACVPNFAIIARLADASDALRFPPRECGEIGDLKRDALPGFFKKWAIVAWGQLLAELPDEDEAALGADSNAGDEFRRIVTDAMNSEIVLGDIIDHTGVTQTERRSLIDWCAKFAKVGPWRSIRSKRCWCKLIDLTGGEVLLRVAIRRELFAQLRADKALCSMNQNTFARRAARYGVGSSARVDRPHGLAAVVLDDAFVESLTAGMTEPEPDTENLADSVAPIPSEGGDQKTEGAF